MCVCVGGGGGGGFVLLVVVVCKFPGSSSNE